MPINKKNQTADRTIIQPALMQQSFIQATLPFAAPEITPKMTPSLASNSASNSASSASSNKNKSRNLLHKLTHEQAGEQKPNLAVKAPKDTEKDLTADLENELKTNVKKDPTQAYAELLKHPQLWRGKDLTKASATQTVASGYSALDDCLAGGGWPNAGLVDFILPHAGIGELRL